MLQIRAASGAAGVPHGDVLAAFAFDVVADDAGAEEAAAGAAAGAARVLGRVVEHVGVAGGGAAVGWFVMGGGLAALDCFALQGVGGAAHGEGIGHLHDDLAFAVRAEAFLAGVLILDLEDMSVGTFDLNSHGRPPEPLEAVKMQAELKDR